MIVSGNIQKGDLEMADKTYDAVIIGGGKAGLILGMYLTKYGGMKVGIFEALYELGGGLACEEPAPGFSASTHAAHMGDWYYLPLEWDFPEWRDMVKYIPYYVAHGSVFIEDQSCVLFYGASADPDQEKTWKEIARFSERDADTWVDYWQRYCKKFYPAFVASLFNPPLPMGAPDPLAAVMTDPAMGIEPIWAVQSPLGVVRDMFESEAVQASLIRIGEAMSGISPDTPGLGLQQFVANFTLAHMGQIEGTSHNVAHAAYKIFLDNGGESFTKHEVEKVIIEHGKARGIRLTDGSEIEARKLVISTLSPQQLVFQLVGEEYFDSRTVRRIKHLSNWSATISWYYWALRELPHYTAAAINSDVDLCTQLALINKDPETTVRHFARKKLGLDYLPGEPPVMVWAASAMDKTLAPEGKAVVGHEVHVLAANEKTEKEWIQFKKSHANDVIRLWQKYAPNMTWDNVIGYYSTTPWDICHIKNMAPTGNMLIIDRIPSQLGNYRPVPELARYKTPIGGLYATGTAWGPTGGAAGACLPYACYKIIADDYGLGKPWEQEGRPF
jgi:phytoene dehydrogenase-like protein